MVSSEALLNLLNKELGYYRALQDLTVQEHSAQSRARPLAEIFPLIKKRRILFNCIAEVESDLLPLRQDWERQPSRQNPAHEAIKERLQELRVLVQDILDLDNRNQKLMQQRLEALRAATVKTGRKHGN